MAGIDTDLHLSWLAMTSVLQTALWRSKTLAPGEILSLHIGPTVWIIYLHLSFPARVGAQFPVSTDPCLSVYALYSFQILGPPLDLIAPATPPPSINPEFAAFVIASVTSPVISALATCMMSFPPNFPTNFFFQSGIASTSNSYRNSSSVFPFFSCSCSSFFDVVLLSSIFSSSCFSSFFFSYYGLADLK